MSGPCAICYMDRETGKRGTNQSTWICPNCKRLEANRDWRASHIIDLSDKVPEASSAGPYETDLCIEIMKLYCLGRSERAIAREVKCQRSYVQRVVQHWRRNHPALLRDIKAGLLSQPS